MSTEKKNIIRHKNITRRDFLLTSSLFCSSILCSSCDGSISNLSPSESKAFIGFEKDILEGLTPFSNYRLVIEKTIHEVGAYYRALHLVCTHQACALNIPDNLKSAEFDSNNKSSIIYSCPCHGARFDANGTVLRGPAIKPLNWLKLSIEEDGGIYFHVNEKVGPEWKLEIISN